MMTTGYIRGLIELWTPMVIINYDMPMPDAYARRVTFTGESWKARNTVFITLFRMHERQRLLSLKAELGLRWILQMYSS
ncbi:unnamed protein product [Gongylonema pulchrum]|uniref:Neur_chan_LBD domain-containing protein n=1 Tax=Gongylonema pulchrum TaxID=637853 RepID=A0A183EZD4_9BILA|nr:unnamed protein product [Gongylonema pulchrum]